MTHVALFDKSDMNAETNNNMNSQSDSFMNGKVAKSTPHSPNDVASAISSETTSETHSVCEEQAAITSTATNRQVFRVVGKCTEFAILFLLLIFPFAGGVLHDIDSV